MSDAPEGPDETRGGMQAGDPGLKGATETGRQGIGYKDTGDQGQGESDRRLPAEQGGNAGAGTG